MKPAQLIAANLAALPHPDGTPRQLPGFSSRLLPEPMQEQIGQTAQEIGEAIVNLLETNGWRITTDAPAPEAPKRTADVVCNHCKTAVLTLNVTTNPVRSNYHFTAEKCPNA